MASTEVWPMIRTERESLAKDLENLTDEQWATTSLCSQWTVRDVLAHMTATAKISPWQFFPKLIAAGFSITRMQAKDIARERGASPTETLDRFRGVLGSTKHPPGPADTWLGEVIVHSGDIRRPLGIEHAYPTGALTRVADFYKGSNLIIGAKRRVAGLTLRATDAEWSHGEGPEVSGPLIALVLAMTGRKAAIDDLTGEGVETLRSRS